MSTDAHVFELLPAYALGSLDEDEATQVADHLSACPVCRAELRSYEEVVGRLALATPDTAPPAELGQKIMGRLQTPRSGVVAEPRRAWWQPLADLFRRPAPGWALASLALVALLITSNLWWWQRANRDEPMVTPGGMRVVAMVGPTTDSAAVGTLVISGDGEYGTLVVDGLSPLDEGHQYQLWLIRDGQRTSGGVFSVNSEGYGALWISSSEPLSSYPAFGITVEPAGGSPGPTGEKVLGGTL